jgi:hypothetical protein
MSLVAEMMPMTRNDWSWNAPSSRATIVRTSSSTTTMNSTLFTDRVTVAPNGS